MLFTINRDKFLEIRAKETAAARAEAASYEAQGIAYVVIDAGDEIICDDCNAEIEDQRIILNPDRHRVYCLACARRALLGRDDA